MNEKKKNQEDPSANGENKPTDFAEAAQEAQMGFFEEFWDFLLHNKKWWITPIVVVLLLVAALVMMGGTAAAPFIYQLF